MAMMSFALPTQPVRGRPQTCDSVMKLAVRALCDEAELTPKPGLVDRRGPGAHTDMTLPLMLRSVAAIAPSLRMMAQAAFLQPVSLRLREELGRLGREAEAVMLATTGGVNTHRGAIWAMGLLVSAAVMQEEELAPERMARTAAELAWLPDRFAPVVPSHGVEAERRFGVVGARGEAQAGFPHVLRYGLPALMDGRGSGLGEHAARTNALLAIMSHLPDTCVLHRGGMEALRLVQTGAAEVLLQGGAGSARGRLALQTLDEALQRNSISPGGSADLLAATIFLDSMQAQKRFEDQPQMQGERAYATDAV